MSHRTASYITEALLSRWLEASEKGRCSGPVQLSEPVTGLCHPLRDMLAINASNQIIGVGTRFTRMGAPADVKRFH